MLEEKVQQQQQKGQEQQQQQQQQHSHSSSSSSSSPQHQSPSQSPRSPEQQPQFKLAKLPKEFSVQCGDATAVFNLSKFGPGSKSKCILYLGNWVSPAQFESLSGKGASHNWRRSIRFNGRPLSRYISNGNIRECEKGCVCPLCIEARQRLKTISRSRTRSRSISGTTTITTAMTSTSTETTTSTSASLIPPNPGKLKVKIECKKKLPKEMMTDIKKDTDSDSGISVASSDPSKTTMTTTMMDSSFDLLPPSHSEMSFENNNSAVATTTTSSIVPPISTFTLESDTPNVTPVEPLKESEVTVETASKDIPDLVTVVQEAIVNLEAATGGCSRLNILLYILNRYKFNDNIMDLNKRLQKTLNFLIRMNILGKRDVNGTDLAAESDVSDDDLSASPHTQPQQQQQSFHSSVNIVKEQQPKQQDTVQTVRKRGRPRKYPINESNNTTALKASTKIKNKALSNANKKQSKPPQPLLKRGTGGKPQKLSPALSAVCGGVKKLNRQEVIKRMWAYVKKKKLQDPEKRGIVICDDKMKALTKRKKINHKELFAYLTPHMTSI